MDTIENEPRFKGRPYPYLRVKIKSLAAEARIIRHEELRFPRGQRDNETYHGLRSHRKNAVGTEARSALLAYGFLRGVPYSSIEQSCYVEPDWVNVLRIARKFGTADEQEFKAWRDDPDVVKLAA